MWLGRLYPVTRGTDGNPLSPSRAPRPPCHCIALTCRRVPPSLRLRPRCHALVDGMLLCPSVPAPLGPLRTVRLWHNNCGPSPAWYVSHVMVKELLKGCGHSWFFPAECWLAAGRWDGRVERELACLRRGPGFWKVGGTMSPCGTPGQLADTVSSSASLGSGFFKLCQVKLCVLSLVNCR